MGEREDIFDDKLRSLMEDAKERVPKRVWSGLSERLAAEGLQKAKPVVIPLWARWSAVGVAVAAALVLGVFLFMRGGETVPEDVLIADVVEKEGVDEQIIESVEDVDVIGESSISEGERVESADSVAHNEAIVAQTENIDGEVVSADDENSVGTSITDAADALASNDTAEVSLAERLAESPKYIAEATDVADAAEVSMPWTDPLAEKVSTGNSKKTHTALTVSGNAFGNASSGSSSSSTGIRRQMASSIDGQPAKGIAEKSDSNYGIPATFGVGVKIIFTPRWSLGVGVNYSLLSRTFSGDYTSYDAVADTYSTESYSNIRHRVDYIGIPVNAYFSIIQSHAVDFYAYAGGTIEKAVSNRYILDHGIPSYKESVRGVQCSTDIGIGVEFIVVDWLGIYIDPSLRYYFPNSHQPKSIRTQESLNFGFEIGLRFRL